jgi:hypothetical protein
MTTQTNADKRTALLFRGDVTRESTVKQYFVKKQTDTGEQSVLVLEGVPVFRSGTFRDSMGSQRTWESLHMSQMVSNFGLLRDRGIFADVPVRKGHPSFLADPMDGLIGYITNLSTADLTSAHDGNKYTYILADYEIPDEAAQKKIQSGLWRNRSAEIGAYVTNDESEFWPTFMGFAYVDIPAVEGLNGAFSKFDHSKFEIMEEAPVGDKDDKGTAPAGQPAAEPAVVLTSNPPQFAAGVNSGTNPPATVHAAPLPTFTVFGKSTTDVSEVQRHIDTLERFQIETREGARKDFVKSLSDAGKILASDVDETTALALSFDDAQYNRWKALQEKVPAAAPLGQHGRTQADENAPKVEKDASEAEYEIALGVVKQMKSAGLMPESIQATGSYKKVIARDPAFKL